MDWKLQTDARKHKFPSLGCLPLTTFYHLNFILVFKVWSILVTGYSGVFRVRIATRSLHILFLTYFVVFHQNESTPFESWTNLQYQNFAVSSVCLNSCSHSSLFRTVQLSIFTKLVSSSQIQPMNQSVNLFVNLFLP